MYGRCMGPAAWNLCSPAVVCCVGTDPLPPQVARGRALVGLEHHKYAKQQLVEMRDALRDIGRAEEVHAVHMDDKCKIPIGLPLAATSRQGGQGGTRHRIPDPQPVGTTRGAASNT